jgi:adenylate cyclase
MEADPPTDPHDDAFFRTMETHRVRAFVRVMRALPGDPRCAVCRAPFGGAGGRMMRRFGYAPSRKNPRLCASCFEMIPLGGARMDVGVLFADVRGFTALAQHQDAAVTAALLNRFYDAAVEVLCRHAIIDKLVGDQVMALYLPRVLGDGAVEHMVRDAQDLLVACPADLNIGIGVDYGSAFVGNVGSGTVKDFTAIGDVVNTAARLQAVAGTGEIVLSRRVVHVTDGELSHAEARVLDLKGKSEPEHVVVLNAAGTAHMERNPERRP